MYGDAGTIFQVDQEEENTGCSFFFNVVVGMILSLLTSVSEIFGILYVVFAIVTLVPSLAVGIRRMHDTGHSGWFILVPIYNLILVLHLGEHKTNKWGPDP